MSGHDRRNAQLASLQAEMGGRSLQEPGRIGRQGEEGHRPAGGARRADGVLLRVRDGPRQRRRPAGRGLLRGPSAEVSASTKPVGSGACPDSGRAAGGAWVPSRLLQRRKLDSLSPSRTQNGSIPRPLAANRASTACHSSRPRRRHLLLRAIALVTLCSSRLNMGRIVPCEGRREKNAAQ